MKNLKMLRYKKIDNIHVKCRNLRPLFVDKYDEEKLWVFHYNGIESTIPFIDYNTAHSILGCSFMQELAKKSPRPIFIQLVTLMCESSHYVMTTNSFECLYRSIDGGVGFIFGIYTVFLYPTTSPRKDTIGFEKVTLRQHRN
jgi:hypothetical protein